jgi:hypothetical protein
MNYTTEKANWIEFILAMIILAMMFIIVYLSLIIDDKNMEIERLQHRIWKYQDRYSVPKKKTDEFNFLFDKIEEIKDHR